MDNGPRDGARGSVEHDADGSILYTVVKGDVGGIVCDRFERKWWQLETQDHQGGFDCYSSISPGQVLVPNTSPTAIAYDPYP